MKKILFVIMLMALLVTPAFANGQYENYDNNGAYLYVHSDQNAAGGTIGAIIPFHIDYFRLGHSVKVSGLEGVAMFGATGAMQNQDMCAKAKATGDGGYNGYYYGYSYNSISWSKSNAPQDGHYSNIYKGNGVYMMQYGSFNQGSQYQSISISAPSGNYYAY